MLPSPGNPCFGGVRRIAGKQFELYESFELHVTKPEKNKAEALEVRKDARQEYKYVRLIANEYGYYALYVRCPRRAA